MENNNKIRRFLLCKNNTCLVTFFSIHYLSQWQVYKAEFFKDFSYGFQIFKQKNTPTDISITSYIDSSFNNRVPVILSGHVNEFCIWNDRVIERYLRNLLNIIATKDDTFNKIISLFLHGVWKLLCNTCETKFARKSRKI